jgi:hypothetical protein
MTKILATGHELTRARDEDRPADQLWLTTNDLQEVTGWLLKPEGLCKEDACVPLSPGLLEKLVDGDEINASGLWTALERPVLHDDGYATWMLGEGARDRSRQLESLVAPDFSLPDIDGNLHSLSDYRGKKVMIASWASW